MERRFLDTCGYVPEELLTRFTSKPRHMCGAFFYTKWLGVLSCRYMLTLYVKTGCPFCNKVLATGKELGISFDEKNIADDAVAAELISRGGKRQVPYLVDSKHGVEMYESGDIVAYLNKGSEPQSKGPSVCNPF